MFLPSWPLNLFDLIITLSLPITCPPFYLSNFKVRFASVSSNVMAPLGRWLEQSVPALLSLSLIYQLAYAGSQSDQSCKSTPGSPSWPSDVAWQQLNTSISGHLLKPLPPAAVCDPTIPGFNNASCTLVYSQYTQSIFHANDPVSVDYPNWENDSCLPFPLGSCKLSQFPVFVVNASEPAHVKAGVDFAREHNVRLIVKGTGHDFLGR